jgi:hypothetical protein
VQNRLKEVILLGILAVIGLFWIIVKTMIRQKKRAEITITIQLLQLIKLMNQHELHRLN